MTTTAQVLWHLRIAPSIVEDLAARGFPVTYVSVSTGDLAVNVGDESPWRAAAALGAVVRGAHDYGPEGRQRPFTEVDVIVRGCRVAILGAFDPQPPQEGAVATPEAVAS